MHLRFELPDGVILSVGEGLPDPRFIVTDYGTSGIGVRLNRRDIQAASAPGLPFYFSTMTWVGGALDGRMIAASTPKREALRVAMSDTYHYLLPGEEFLIPAATAVREPSLQRVAAVRSIIFPRLRMHNLTGRAARLLELFEVHDSPKDEPDGVGQDFEWLQRNWNFAFGGAQRPDFYGPFAPLGGDGYSNGHYAIGFLQCLAYLRNPTTRTFEVGMASALLRATSGMHRAAPFFGMLRSEKSGLLIPRQQFIGAGFDPDWSKQWVHDLAAWWMLTGSEVLEAALRDHFAAAETAAFSPATRVAWGERGMAWLLESLRIGYQLFGRLNCRNAAQVLLDRIEAQMDADGLWSGAEGDHNWWMACKLVAAAAGHGRIWNRTLDRLASMVQWDSRGYPMCPYYYAPSISFSLSHPSTHGAWFSWALAACGRKDDAARVEGKVIEYLGSLWSDVAAGVPRPEAELDFRMGNQGGGWTKSVPIVLLGLLFSDWRVSQ